MRNDELMWMGGMEVRDSEQGTFDDLMEASLWVHDR
jgi:hypothetical protein